MDAQPNTSEELLDRLNQINSVRGFLVVALDAIEESMDELIRGSFRKEEYAVQYAVDPLLGQAGPLSDLDVRLKLMLALGLLSHDLYLDIEQLLKLRQFLLHDVNDYRFTDRQVLDRIKSLKTLPKVSFSPLDVPSISDEQDPQFYAMQMQRYENLIKSTLALVVEHIVSALQKTHPL